MQSSPKSKSHELTAHFFRKEYGKLVAVISRLLGNENVETAEDIVQETLLKATQYWDLNGVPDNPKAWLYTTARNLSLNTLKRKKYQRDYVAKSTLPAQWGSEIPFSEELIADSQLRMMFSCCHESIPENSRIALVLKILSGFNIAEIADAFFSKTETINKRLVRGRKQLRKVDLELHSEKALNERLDSVLKTIYLMFNEGYFPSSKNQVIRFDLCLEAIRISQLLIEAKSINDKTNAHALLALMYFNSSRFQSRISAVGEIIDLKEQDRSKWDSQLVQRGIHHLNQITQGKVSKYGILAAISANHCIASSYESTNWEGILSLYDQLLKLEDSPIVLLNRGVALAEAKGAKKAISELSQLGTKSDIDKYYLYHFTMAELFKQDFQWKNAQDSYLRAFNLANNPRDRELLKKKMKILVPNLSS